MTPRFVICSPAYNASPFIEKSLQSALGQVYDQFRILHLDDASTDDSKARAREVVGRDGRVTFLENPCRYGATRNYWFLAQHCDPDEVLVVLDADDWLAHPGVLRRLAGLYLVDKVWMTYGQFRYDEVSGGGIGMAALIPPENHTRRAGWRSTHLKTCYAGMIQMIPQSALLVPGTSQFFPVSGDLALFYPVLEMAGPRRARFVSEVLYIYNLQNPINDVKVQPKEQKSWAAFIEAQLPFPRLEVLPWE